MLIKNLRFEAIPNLEISDQILRALELMHDLHVRHVAITRGNEYAGLCSEDVLMDMDENITFEEIEPSLLRVSVKEDDHFLNAVLLAANYHLTVIPVIDEAHNLVATIESNHLLKNISDFLHLKEPAGMIVLEMDTQQYSFSEISKIVEANDAQITQLNTTKNNADGTMEVTVCVNKLEISDIVATFQRYDYVVKYYFGEELYTNELKDNYENLMNYLNI
ncbi:MAG: CBS domain-containing protein [Sphingobacteriales bacterium]|jgi:acetoin utilization protein AcuB|nr:CBS domain-containing protein [Sphingobacteriales bacterium]